MTTLDRPHQSVRSVRKVRARTAAFVAPCLPDARIRTRIDGTVGTFQPQPAGFVGWGIFQADRDGRTARLLEAAGPAIVAAYLDLFPAATVRLLCPLDGAGREFLAYPEHEADWRQRFGTPRPLIVRLSASAAPFDAVRVRAAGSGVWLFEGSDLRSDPQTAARLQAASTALTAPDALRIPGLTPEQRCAYALALPIGAEARRRIARGSSLLATWTTTDGARHTSAVRRGDSALLTSGVCFVGREGGLDLGSLVRVTEERL